MADTVSAYQIPQEWTDLNTLTGKVIGVELLLQNVGQPGDIVELAFAELMPAAEFRGVRLDQLKSMYQVAPDQPRVWVRFIRVDNRQATYPNKFTHLQVISPADVSPFTASVPGSALADDGLGGYRLRVSNEEAVINSAFNGDVFTVSGEASLGGNDTVALNFNVGEKLIHISSVANGQAEIEISIHKGLATGSFNSNLPPFNRNLTSNKLPKTVVSFLTSATASGGLIDFGADRLGRSVITDVGFDFCVLVQRRDNGSAETVKFAATFEVIPKPPGLPEELTFDGAPLTYNLTEDLFYVS